MTDLKILRKLIDENAEVLEIATQWKKVAAPIIEKMGHTEKKRFAGYQTRKVACQEAEFPPVYLFLHSREFFPVLSLFEKKS
jgi:hypothetical protein